MYIRDGCGIAYVSICSCHSSIIFQLVGQGFEIPTFAWPLRWMTKILCTYVIIYLLRCFSYLWNHRIYFVCKWCVCLLKIWWSFQTQGMNLMDFKMKWQHWQQEVQQILDQGTLYASEELTQIAQVHCFFHWSPQFSFLFINCQQCWHS